MKKILVTVLLTTSALLFAKNESPNKNTESKKATETVLVAKKTIQTADQQQKPITISTTAKEIELTTAEKCAIELALGSVIAGPPYHCLQL
ncbi:hypothetical protein [Chryseobacterium viscerum]|jgi:hypothetical protein|uniref:Uncharacterized protein n=1 Tax=Chryseobacterium viscerum TaxID=1037377 RepID=A0A316WX33_9FLAO|nr:hypothetical protein [Chryseobacterium viscerum]KAB1231729.1 hypothetical protein F8D52_03575 [Chryseobacterium viscerum]PWN65739.1 hypothetical protein C1634_003100 [Chryseobacterium viscerum]